MSQERAANGEKPGTTLRRYMKVITILDQNPGLTCDTPIPELKALGVVPISAFNPHYSSYDQIFEPQERKQEENEAHSEVTRVVRRLKKDLRGNLTEPQNVDKFDKAIGTMMLGLNVINKASEWEDEPGEPNDPDTDYKSRMRDIHTKLGGTLYFQEQMRKFRAITVDEKND